MDPERSNNSKKKGKEPMIEDVSEATTDSKREPNWTVSETTVLLNVVQQIQTRRGRKGFHFTKAERLDIYRLFKASLTHTTREKNKTCNRLKVILSRFKVCNELANRSGGGWDDENHRPIAPSAEEYVQMIQEKGEGGRFLLKSNFPWYHQMVEMVGGQSARGAVRANTVDEEEPIEVIYAEQMSLQISEQGSSDDPEDGNPKTNTKSSVHGSRKGAASSRAAGTEDSDGTIPPLGNSGSKRKSTDDSSEVDTRGKRYKDRNRKKKEQGERLADAGLKLADVMEKQYKRKMSREEQYDRCLEKFEEIGIRKSALSFAMSACKKDSMRRKWILKNDRETILEWIEDNIGPRSHAPPPPQPM